MNWNKKLGFGFFRLPVFDGKPDIVQCKQMVDKFISEGFNYFDVAKPYMSGRAESIFRECVSMRYSREHYILADKLSPGLFQSKEDIYSVFSRQLHDCGVNYFDLYMMHCQTRVNYDFFQKCEAYEVAQELKEQGKIKYIGFSFHDTADYLEKILIDHPLLDFVQLQVNYYDYEDEVVQSKKCLEICKKYKKPVIVMEPVKGGTLVKLPQKAEQLLESMDSSGSNASYAIRFAAGCEGVVMVLSGMSDINQLNDNVSYMTKFIQLTNNETEILKEVREIIRSRGHIQCTGCKYCLNECIKEINIPSILATINSKTDFKYNFQFDEYYWNVYTHNRGKAGDCVKCGKCEKVCPQHLPIREYMERAHRLFETQEAYFDDILPVIREYKEKNNKFIVYGAGNFGKKAIEYFNKHLPDINIISIAVSHKLQEKKKIYGIEVVCIEDLISFKQVAMVLIMSVVPWNINDMKKKLDELQFENKIDIYGN